MYFTIRRWQHAKDKTFSLSEWANMLGVARSTMQRIFDRMEEKNLLYIESGKQYQTSNGDIRQENNKYYLVGVDDDGRQTDDIDTDIDTKKKQIASQLLTNRHSDRQASKPITNNIITDSRVLERDNLIDDDKRMNEDDFWIYVTTEDPVVKRLADERFARISKTQNGKKFVDNMLCKWLGSNLLKTET